MEKPNVILCLEKELKCSFKIVELNITEESKYHKTSEYSVDKNNNITGIAICNFDLKEIPISMLDNVKELNCLINLNLRGNQIHDISFFKNLRTIQKLDFSYNQITNINPLKELFEIKQIYASENRINDITPLEGLKDIQILTLRNNQISDIFPLKELKNLKKLRLQGNPIKNLSDWITDFPEMDIIWYNIDIEGFISFYDNPIESPPLEILKKGTVSIKAWFAEQKKSKSIPNPSVKLILTGNTTVGKTSLINFLTKQTYIEGEITTHGIKQTTWKPTNTNLDINIWDFGGQEYYHSTHQLFFSNNALYLLMFDKQHNCNGWLQTEIDYADKGKVTEELEHFDYFYWLRNIRNLSDKSKILMLQNKVENRKDIVYPEKDCFDENLEYKVEDYQATSVLNAYKSYKENQKFSYEFKEIQKLIISKLNDVKRGEIFEYYLKAKELIETAAQTKQVVNIDEFIEICKPANENIANIITDSDGNETEYTAWKLMCVYFHETGLLLYYPDSPTLKEKIFIRPTFVTDTIYKVLNYKVKEAFGRFTFEDAVQSLDNDTVLAQDIIELMSAPNFKLIFNEPEKPDCFVAPQYLDDKKPSSNLLKNLEKYLEIGFVLEFTQFLPKFILTEFMVNYGFFHKDNTIWKYGIVFEKYGTTAFVECMFEERKIIYKSDNQGEFNKLKYEVFESFRNINQSDKNLKIGLDLENTYSLENVLRDGSLEKFRLFRIGYVEYKKEFEISIEKLTERRIFYEKERIKTSDSEKQFDLLKKIEELENQIHVLKKRK